VSITSVIMYSSGIYTMALALSVSGHKGHLAC